MLLVCAFCSTVIEDAPYRGEFKVIPYCSQQHWRQDQHRHLHPGTLEQAMGDVLNVLEHNDAPSSIVQKAFEGSIPDMAKLLPFADVSVFVFSLFPVKHHQRLFTMFKEPNLVYLSSQLVDFFSNTY